MTKEKLLEEGEADVGESSKTGEMQNAKQEHVGVPTVPKEFRTWDAEMSENKTY